MVVEIIKKGRTQLDYAAILAPDGTEAALLNVSRYNTGHTVEWLTVHK